ncbi:MAG: hypothetical protein KJZ70_05460, partial [Bryobacterales bacterium]|nr:hypothetical protein [Bryobacterales bacterium]
MHRRAAHPEGLVLTKPNGDQRGFVDPKRSDGGHVLEDLWVMQGSVCDRKRPPTTVFPAPRFFPTLG